MEERIIELEKKAAFQEHMIEEMNEMLILQQKQIADLQNHLEHFKENFINGDLVKKQEDEDLPPHY